MLDEKTRHHRHEARVARRRKRKRRRKGTSEAPRRPPRREMVPAAAETVERLHGTSEAEKAAQRVAQRGGWVKRIFRRGKV